MNDALSAGDAVVEFDGVSKAYKPAAIGRAPVLALVDVSLTVARGEVLGLLGPNRAGKTTLLKILLSVAKPTSGNVTRFGRPLRDRTALARIGYVHENHAFPRYLTAWEVLHYYGALAGVGRATLADRVPRLLERVGLADRARESIGRFSKGMVQRLGLAQALVNEPDLLVLDEPTEGLDFEGRRAIRTLVEEWRGERRSAILVSHALAEVERLCDTAAVLERGRLIYRGKLDDLRQGRPLETALEALYCKGAAA
jgi:ABC-2 type transport system ATP-binding protein